MDTLLCTLRKWVAWNVDYGTHAWVGKHLCGAKQDSAPKVTCTLAKCRHLSKSFVSGKMGEMTLLLVCYEAFRCGPPGTNHDPLEAAPIHNQTTDAYATLGESGARDASRHYRQTMPKRRR